MTCPPFGKKNSGLPLKMGNGPVMALAVDAADGNKKIKIG